MGYSTRHEAWDKQIAVKSLLSLIFEREKNMLVQDTCWFYIRNSSLPAPDRSQINIWPLVEPTEITHQLVSLKKNSGVCNSNAKLLLQKHAMNR